MTDKQLKAVAMPGDFIFHSSWFEIFKSFDMQTAYAILMAMINYVQTGAVPADDELRRLTVFLFAHIDTDRERLLALQPKRRTSAKKKTAPETTVPDPGPGDVPIPQTSTPSDTSITSVISDISDKFHGSAHPREERGGCGPDAAQSYIDSKAEKHCDCRRKRKVDICHPGSVGRN